MIQELDKSKFNALNYTVYGSVSSQILNKDYRLIIGYSYETEYEPMKGFGGVMFMTPKEPKWSHVRKETIDQMLEDLGGRTNLQHS